uniref:Wound-responsive family protein n=1 Tax=Kalanchoe fedtschenkoi TaxID=63787 RepID=A0A7N0U3D3_KALFE
MSLRSRAWIVAATVRAVEAMKDQGFARWNYTIRSVHQHAKNNLRSYSQAKKLFATANRAATEEKARQAEESLRRVIYLSYWGPN